MKNVKIPVWVINLNTLELPGREKEGHNPKQNPLLVVRDQSTKILLIMAHALFIFSFRAGARRLKKRISDFARCFPDNWKARVGQNCADSLKSRTLSGNYCILSLARRGYVRKCLSGEWTMWGVAPPQWRRIHYQCTSFPNFCGLNHKNRT